MQTLQPIKRPKVHEYIVKVLLHPFSKKLHFVHQELENQLLKGQTTKRTCNLLQVVRNYVLLLVFSSLELIYFYQLKVETSSRSKMERIVFRSYMNISTRTICPHLPWGKAAITLSCILIYHSRFVKQNQFYQARTIHTSVQQVVLLTSALCLVASSSSYI